MLGLGLGELDMKNKAEIWLSIHSCFLGLRGTAVELQGSIFVYVLMSLRKVTNGVFSLRGVTRLGSARHGSRFHCSLVRFRVGGVIHMSL